MGWNGSDDKNVPISNNVGNTKNQRDEKQLPKWVLILASALVLILAVCFLFWPNQATRQDVEKEETAMSGEIPVVKPEPKPPRTAEQLEQDAHPGMRKTATGVWLPADRPYPPGRTKPHGIVTNSLNSSRQNITHSTLEQVLLGMFSRRLGDMPMPLPRNVAINDANKLAAILAGTDKLKDSNDQVTAEQIKILKEVKKALADYIKEGGTQEEFVSYYHGELQKAYQLRTEAQRIVNKAAREGMPPEDVAALVEKYNDMLDSKGIRPLAAPIN